MISRGKAAGFPRNEIKRRFYDRESSCRQASFYDSGSGTYSRMSSTRQSRISHRVFRVVVVMALPCFMRWRVLAVTPCLKMR